MCKKQALRCRKYISIGCFALALLFEFVYFPQPLKNDSSILFILDLSWILSYSQLKLQSRYLLQLFLSLGLGFFFFYNTEPCLGKWLMEKHFEWQPTIRIAIFLIHSEEKYDFNLNLKKYHQFSNIGQHSKFYL